MLLLLPISSQLHFQKTHKQNIIAAVNPWAARMQINMTKSRWRSWPKITITLCTWPKEIKLWQKAKEDYQRVQCIIALLKPWFLLRQHGDYPCPHWEAIQEQNYTSSHPVMPSPMLVVEPLIAKFSRMNANIQHPLEPDKVLGLAKSSYAAHKSKRKWLRSRLPTTVLTLWRTARLQLVVSSWKVSSSATQS